MRFLQAMTIIAVLLCAMAAQAQANPFAPAEFAITDTVLRPKDKVPPLGVNDFGRGGAVEWAANNFVQNAGNEPLVWRNMHRAKTVGKGWFEIDGPGTSWWELWSSGFLSGANVRIYRLVDKAGKPLPAAGATLDLTNADHFIKVGESKVIADGAKDFPDGGWIANKYTNVFPNTMIRHGNIAVTDTSGIENGRTYWYTVVAVSVDDKESVIANEASVIPDAKAVTPPRILVHADGDKLPTVKANANFDFTPKSFSGTAPLTWDVIDVAGNPLALPAGLTCDPATGRISGKLTEDVNDFLFMARVTDAKKLTSARRYLLNPRAPQGAAAEKGVPQPPTEVKAVAGNGCAIIYWKASPSPNVVGYRIKRSSAPAAKQETRVYLEDGAPELQPWDYVVLDRQFAPFQMRYINSRVRGIGNPMDTPNWYWRGDLTKLAFALAPHAQPLPKEMIDPGQACLQITAKAGAQNINQFVFIGLDKGGESLWYGQLEPEKKYRLEVWLRQEGLANTGAVTFSYGRGYAGIKKEFAVTKEWQKFTYDFTGPARPPSEWHFGHQFDFTGPGTLWMDNCRIFRVDDPADADKPYLPNKTVLNELLAAQPETGRKGAHRTWFLNKDTTMDSILSWHANSSISPDWNTSVHGTMEMTLPMGLTFDLHTGTDATNRMRPWLVLQHSLHSEQDWLNLVEYLAAPYDPKVDTPETKAYAYRRTQQRGVDTPWIAEFEHITIEFGNETWHNGIFADWIGFATRNAVHQGGKEYGYFTRYLIETMKKSPYWKTQGLDAKLRFDLGANYDARIAPDGTVSGYGEEAMQTNGQAHMIGHANYVGPKWETGDYSARTYDDHGVQETLISFLTGAEQGQIKMMLAQQALAKKGLNFDIAAYEGGPGGYALPGSAPADQVETNEKYGKSLAMAVGVTDGWLRSYQYGWTDQCFLGYGQGNYWNSHSNFATGFLPSPGWQALALRNRYASGDLMQVVEINAPTLQRGKQTFPLAGAYAMRDGNRWSIFVVSRKLDGKHDNVDFKEGGTPVTLTLPFMTAEKITLHTLTGDPRLTNRAKLNIEIKHQEIPATTLDEGQFAVTEQTGASKTGLPPGSIFLYVFEGVKK